MSKERLDKVSNYIPWNIPIQHSSILMSYTGALHKVYRVISLIDLTRVSVDEKVSISKQINDVFSMMENKWSIWIEDKKQLVDAYPLMEEDKVSKALKMLDDDRRQDISGIHYKNTLYMTFVYNPGITNPSDFEEQIEKNLKLFNTTINHFIDSMASLVIFNELSQDETATYLYQCLSGKDCQVRWDAWTDDFGDGLIDQQVTKCPAKIGDKYIVVLGIKKFPPAFMNDMSNALQNVFCNYRQVIRLNFKDRNKGIEELEARERQWIETDQKILPGIWNFFNRRHQETPHINEAILEKAGNCYGLKQELIRGATNVCDYTHTFILIGEDQHKVIQDAEKIKSALNTAQFVIFFETKNTLAAWLGSLPGNVNNPRKHLMSITHLSDLLPISSKYQGIQKNKLGLNALCLAKTEDTSPFWFNLDGHAMMIGPTGSGKSYFLCAMMAFFSQYHHAQLFAFDKGKSLKTTTEAFDGKHIDLKNRAMQPLRKIDHEQEFKWAVSWIMELLHLANFQIKSATENQVQDALRSLKTRPVDERTISGLIDFADSEIRDALKQYKNTEIDGKSVDDAISEKTWICFEMGRMFEENNKIAILILLFIFHEIENRLRRSIPTLIILDEVWLYLENTIFSMRIKLWLKTFRKLWGYVVFATQELDDIQNSSIYSSLENSTHTEIWLPNRKALKEENKIFFRKAGLSDIEINQLSIKSPQKDYLIKQPEGKRWIQIGGGKITRSLLSG